MQAIYAGCVREYLSPFLFASPLNSWQLFWNFLPRNCASNVPATNRSCSLVGALISIQPLNFFVRPTPLHYDCNPLLAHPHPLNSGTTTIIFPTLLVQALLLDDSRPATEHAVHDRRLAQRNGFDPLLSRRPLHLPVLSLGPPLFNHSDSNQTFNRYLLSSPSQDSLSESLSF